MNATPADKPPTWYWIISGILFVWMLFGIMAFAMDLMTDEAAVAQFTEAQRQLYASRPSWLLAVYALATGSGLVGALGLLLRKAWARPALIVSFVTVCVQMGYTLFVLDAITLLGAAAAVPFPLVICLIGAFAVWFATMAGKRGIVS